MYVDFVNYFHDNKSFSIDTVDTLLRKMLIQNIKLNLRVFCNDFYSANDWLDITW